MLAAAEPPDYILLLNPDTVVRPGAIVELLQFMEASPKVGLTGARLEEPDGTPQRSAFRFPTVLGELENGVRLGVLTRLLSRNVVAPPVSAEASRADWLSGACLMVRREVFDAVGLLDEGYLPLLRRGRFLPAGGLGRVAVLVCPGCPRRSSCRR